MLMPVPSAANCRVSCLSNESELVGLRDDWNRLAQRMPMRGYEWATAWWEHYRSSHTSLHVLVVRDECDCIIGIAPWYLTESRLTGRIIRFLGSGEVCSDYLSVLCEEHQQEEVVDAVSDYLLKHRRDWDVVELSGVEQHDAVADRLAERLAGFGHHVDVRTRWNGWRLALPEDWPTFLSRLSKSRRERTRKLERQNLATGRATLRPINDQQELNDAFGLLVDLHQKRRASIGEKGCFHSARLTAFHRQVCHELLSCGQLRFLVLELDGRAIAAEYGLTSDDTVYYYQGGFDPQFADERPGWLSFAASLKLAIEQGYQYYDFLRGDEPYKAHWRAEPRPTWRRQATAPRALPKLRRQTWAGARRVGQLARQFTGLFG
jgi:CelD/BcsL family acetyltransferase involved in cellulose biosynthesis